MSSLMILIVVLDTTKVQIFKQITTSQTCSRKASQLFQIPQRYRFSSKSQQFRLLNLTLLGCFRYHKGTDFQANHNTTRSKWCNACVVLDTTKVQIFKQITTALVSGQHVNTLFQIPQRYRFSSKSQLKVKKFVSVLSCFRYHKGTDFQANHNTQPRKNLTRVLFQIPQRYRFSSKSQQPLVSDNVSYCCFRYHKGTDFQANHN